MQKDIISKKHISSLLMLFIIGSSLALGVSSKIGQDTWISILLLLVAIIPLVLVYARIIKLFPDKNLYDIVVDLFGGIIGKVFVFLIMVYSIFLGSLVLRNFSEFIQVTALQETPQVPIMIAIMIVIFYLVKSGTQTMGKWAVIVLPVVVLIVLITLLLSLGSANFTNIFPIMNHNFKEITVSSMNAFAFPFAEIVLFLTFSESFEKGSNPKKYLYIQS